MLKSIWQTQSRIDLIRKTKEKKFDLKELESRDWRDDTESKVIRNLFGGREEIKVSASIIAYNSAVKEEEVSDKFLINEMYKSGIN